jgi:hypothetical protein
VRLKELEKIAFDKEAGRGLNLLYGAGSLAGRALGLPVTGAVNALKGVAKVTPEALKRAPGTLINSTLGALASGGTSVATTVGGGALAAGGGLAGGIAREIGGGVVMPALRGIGGALQKNPISTSGKLLFGGMMVPEVANNFSGSRYFPRMARPTEQTLSADFGRKMDPTAWLEKRNEEEPMTYGRLRKPLSELEKTAAKIPPPATIADQAMKVTGMIGLSALFGPTIKTLGEKMQKKVFGVSDRLNAEDEIQKARLKALGEFMASEEVKEQKRKAKEKNVLPAMNVVLDHLKKNDKHISEAWKDPTLKAVINQTAHTVYSFAPDVSRDPRAMRSILREAVTSPDGGLSFQTVKQIAETQKFISEGKKS